MFTTVSYPMMFESHYVHHPTMSGHITNVSSLMDTMLVMAF